MSRRCRCFFVHLQHAHVVVYDSAAAQLLVADALPGAQARGVALARLQAPGSSSRRTPGLKGSP